LLKVDARREKSCGVAVIDRFQRRFRAVQKFVQMMKKKRYTGGSWILVLLDLLPCADAVVTWSACAVGTRSCTELQRAPAYPFQTERHN
jgi:hypothetical protein